MSEPDAEDILELEDEAEDQEAPDSNDADTDEQPEAEEEGGGDNDILIGFGDDEIEAEPENATMRQMREALKEKERLLREARAKIPKVEVGPKPTLESCDYDEERYDTEVEHWKARKAQAEAEAQSAAEQSTAAREDFGVELAEYQQQKTKLARPDFDAAELIVTGKLDPVQQSVLVMASKNKAALIYALGKSPERLEALAGIRNPIKLAIAVNDMERGLKVQARRKAPEPQPRMRGGTPANGPNDKHLSRLEAEADRTGDRSKLVAYRRSLKGR